MRMLGLQEHYLRFDNIYGTNLLVCVSLLVKQIEFMIIICKPKKKTQEDKKIIIAHLKFVTCICFVALTKK